MSAFRSELDRLRGPGSDGDRRWVFVPHDQLTDRVGPLAERDPEATGIVLVESEARARSRSYHRQKLALVLANQRHFALEQARRGVAVEFIETDGNEADALAGLADGRGSLVVMEPAERELRKILEPLGNRGELEVVPNELWLTSKDDFVEGAGPEPPWRMDRFYRHVRKATGILVSNGRPVGGKWSHDAQNREPWRGEPEPPPAPRFPRDAIKDEVVELVASRFDDHPGRLDPEALPATAADARRLWDRALEDCLPAFGPYEDAMTVRSSGLFHTRISPLLNLGRLLPVDLVRDVEAAGAPLPSREGFIRQVLGWREFVRHVHRETDGFRTLDADAAPNHLGAREKLPPAFWGTPSGLHCLDRVVADVWEEGYGHHITRLMVLGNLATLLDVEPRDLSDWFHVAYTDAYDWVVEPNVLGMATFAAGDLMTTKPYVAGARYISRMSDYCGECAFDPKSSCPITRLYWAFLVRHEKTLADVGRMKPMLKSLEKRTAEKRAEDREVFERTRRLLAAGETVAPVEDPS